MPIENSYTVLFSAEGATPGLLRPVRLFSREELSRSDATVVELRLDDIVPVEPTALLRKTGEVAVVRDADGVIVHRFRGLITKVRERADRLNTHQRISVTIESPFHLLRVSSDSRIFQNLTTKDIVSAVLAGAGLDSLVEWKLRKTYKPREVCTQYGETNFDFISRLLEEDGIFYFVEQKDDGKIVFGDGDAAYGETVDGPLVAMHAQSGLTVDESITQLRAVERVHAARVLLRDHDFKKPSLDVSGAASAKSPFDREYYDYPGRFIEPAVGATRAEVAQASMVAASSGFEGSGHVWRLAAGHVIELSDPLIGASGDKWVVQWAEHVWIMDGTTHSYETRFRLLKTTTRFCPLQITPPPRIDGVHTATVTGPAGEEIHCDEFGRIRVQFSWDRHGKHDEKSSGWVRVGQLHTSGSVAIPRIGWEVLVDFENGDPDRPIVLGRVFNGVFGPPQTLPGSKTVTNLGSFSTPGGGGQNEIKMNDGGGSEVVAIHAQKDLNLTVGNNKEEKVTNNVSIDVGADQKMKIGANQTFQVGSNDSVKIGGAQTYSVSAARTKTVSGDDKVDVTGSRSVTIGAGHTTLTPMSYTVSTSGDLSETVGASCIEAAAMGLAYSVAGSASFTIGAAKVEAVASGKTDSTMGARSATVGGAWMNLSGKDVGTTTSSAKATTVGGAFLSNAGANVEFSSDAALDVTVGGAVILTGATKLILKVGGSNITLAGGKVVIESSEIKLTATGPLAEMAPMVASK